MSDLGSAHIFIIEALTIIGRTGGSITCTPDQNRMWKVRNHDCSCESIYLSNACRAFVKDYLERQEGTLS